MRTKKGGKNYKCESSITMSNNNNRTRTTPNYGLNNVKMNGKIDVPDMTKLLGNNNEDGLRKKLLSVKNSEMASIIASEAPDIDLNSIKKQVSSDGIDGIVDVLKENPEAIGQAKDMAKQAINQAPIPGFAKGIAKSVAGKAMNVASKPQNMEKMAGIAKKFIKGGKNSRKNNKKYSRKKRKYRRKRNRKKSKRLL